MLEIDRSREVRPGVYFRVDAGVWSPAPSYEPYSPPLDLVDDEYPFRDCRRHVKALVTAGLEVGLHSVCYTAEDVWGAFRAETEKFEEESGVRPRSFTMHGLGTQRLDVRLRFVAEIAERIEDFGDVFSDVHPKLREYDFVLEKPPHDSRWDEAREARVLRDDFVRFPVGAPSIGRCLVLTHPCYWRPE